MALVRGLTVISTTRNTDKVDFLKKNGADHVIIDTGSIQKEVRNMVPEGVNKVLELIGTRTLKDSLSCIAAKGFVCMTGILGNEWTMKEFTPMGDIPSLGRLTVYMGDANNLNKERLQEFIDSVAAGDIQLTIDRVLSLEDLPEAHQYMEDGKGKGKMVVVVDGGR